MISKAKTVKDYIESLPPDRKKAIIAVRKVILANLPKGYEEVMAYGMIGYVVPLERYPQGYGENKKVPLPLAALASQKNYMALYLMCTYGNKNLDAWFRKAYAASGKKLDMGKGCVRFKTLEDLPLDVIGKLFTKVPVETFIAMYRRVRGV